MKYLMIGTIATAFLGINSTAHSQQPRDVTAEKIEDVYFSEECGEVDYQALSFGKGIAKDGERVMQDALEVSFAELAAQIDGKGRNSVDCLMEVTVRVPAGKRFRAVKAYTEGTYSIGNRAQGSIFIDYQVQETGAQGICDKKGLTGADDFTLTAELDNSQFTQCYDYPTTVTLSTSINGSISSKGDDFSEIIFDQRDSDSIVKWDWNWQPCPELSKFEGEEFIAARGKRTGRLEDAHVNISGNRGTFETREGTGYLENIRFSQEGYVAEGRWQQGRYRGSFQFEITDLDGNVFKGTYTNEVTGESGEWKGYR